MGIRGLTPILKQFASEQQLRGRVVIDGPALAYHILRSSRHNVSSILDEPSYSVLGEAATQWLDNLQSCGLQVAAIYFDGSLPPSKKEVRHERMCERSGDSHQYFLKTAAGIKADGGVPKRFIPDPPLVVPAILEALRSVEIYGRLTFLVPGEADPYCADDVKRNGGLLLTSDSDLLLYDLGPTGSVVFLKDLQLHTGDATDARITEGGSSFSALTYKQSELCRKMLLELGQLDMLRFGFEMKLHRFRSLNVLNNQSKWAYLDDTHAKEFAEFVAEYQEPPSLTTVMLDPKSPLDPRISEFIFDWATSITSSGELGSTKDLTVWLPSLVDRWDQASAWDLGTTIRQLAYSLCQGSKRSNSTVTEYRRTLSVRSAGQAVDLLDEPEARVPIDGLVTYLDPFVRAATVPTALRWLTVCLGIEIGQSAQEGKRSNALELWRKAAKSQGTLQPGDWDAVHVVAQLVGTLYSFRMLQQVLSIRREGLLPGATSSDQVGRLEAQLSSLPAIAEFPAAADMSDMFKRLHQAGQLDVLAEATGVTAIPFEGSDKAVQSLKARQRKARRQEQTRPRARASQSQASTNPFEALSTVN